MENCCLYANKLGFKRQLLEGVSVVQSRFLKSMLESILFVHEFEFERITCNAVPVLRDSILVPRILYMYCVSYMSFALITYLLTFVLASHLADKTSCR